MNVLNVRAAYRRFSHPRLRISLCALIVLGLATPAGVSASAKTMSLIGSGANAEATANANANDKAKVKATVKATGRAQQSVSGSAKRSPQQSPESITKVDLNIASAEQLASALKGVGSAKAKAIVRYRTEVGPFRSIAELEEVKGIGPSIVALNKERISVSRAKR